MYILAFPHMQHMVGWYVTCETQVAVGSKVLLVRCTVYVASHLGTEACFRCRVFLIATLVFAIS